MTVLLDANTRCVVFGITGKEGSRATKEMIEYGTQVSCGITPGKGGTEIEVKKVFDSLSEALAFDPKINAAVLYVPPLMTLDAATEAIVHNIPLVVIITENVPIKDSCKILAMAKEHNCRVIGPSSVGIITVGKAKIGSIASNREKKAFTPGRVGIISKSGGLCSETAALLSRQALGQSTVIGIGGDALIGTTIADALLLFETDDDTDVIVIIGEIGGMYEEQAAELIKQRKITKPVIALVCGRFAESIPRELAFGHAGAIIENNTGTSENKKKALADAGAIIARYHHEIPDLVNRELVRIKAKRE